MARCLLLGGGEETTQKCRSCDPRRHLEVMTGIRGNLPVARSRAAPWCVSWVSGLPPLRGMHLPSRSLEVGGHIPLRASAATLLQGFHRSVETPPTPLTGCVFSPRSDQILRRRGENEPAGPWA